MIIQINAPYMVKTTVLGNLEQILVETHQVNVTPDLLRADCYETMVTRN